MVCRVNYYNGYVVGAERNEKAAAAALRNA